MTADPRHTRAWRKLRDQVIAEEPLCWLAFPHICTRVSTTGDHIEPVTQRPDLALTRSNIRGACQPCNTARRNTPASMLRLDTPNALGFFGG
jgi:5-methylcytosine-specific restriction endonuclease McrA